MWLREACAEPDKSSEESSIGGYFMYIKCSWHKVSRAANTGEGVAICLPWSYPSLPICCRMLQGRTLAKIVLPATAMECSSVVRFMAEDAWHIWKWFSGLAQISSLTSSEKLCHLSRNRPPVGGWQPFSPFGSLSSDSGSGFNLAARLCCLESPVGLWHSTGEKPSPD